MLEGPILAPRRRFRPQRGERLVTGSKVGTEWSFTCRFKRWLLAEVVEDVPGPQAKEGRSEQHPW